MPKIPDLIADIIARAAEFGVVATPRLAEYSEYTKTYLKRTIILEDKLFKVLVSKNLLYRGKAPKFAFILPRATVDTHGGVLFVAIYEPKEPEYLVVRSEILKETYFVDAHMEKVVVRIPIEAHPVYQETSPHFNLREYKDKWRE